MGNSYFNANAGTWPFQVQSTLPNAVLLQTTDGSANLAIGLVSGGGRITLLGNGNVGIGRNDPGYPLHFGSQANNAFVEPGGAWNSGSSRASKENFAAVDGPALLQTLDQLSVSTWNYKVEGPTVRHIGPTAEDFSAAFQVGIDDAHISTVDADGVALAAAQALYRRSREQDAQITALQQHNADLAARVAALEQVSGTGNAPARPLGTDWGSLALAASGLILAAALYTRRA